MRFSYFFLSKIFFLFLGCFLTLYCSKRAYEKMMPTDQLFLSVDQDMYPSKKDTYYYFKNVAKDKYLKMICYDEMAIIYDHEMLSQLEGEQIAFWQKKINDAQQKKLLKIYSSIPNPSFSRKFQFISLEEVQKKLRNASTIKQVFVFLDEKDNTNIHFWCNKESILNKENSLKKYFVYTYKKQIDRNSPKKLKNKEEKKIIQKAVENLINNSRIEEELLKINQKISQNKSLNNKDYKFFCDTLEDQKIFLRVKKEVISILQSIGVYHGRLPIMMMTCVQDIIKKKEKKNLALISYLEENLGYLLHKSIVNPSKFKLHTGQKQKIVAKEKVRQRKQMQLDEDILDKHLENKNQLKRNRQVAQAKRTNAQKLPEPDGELYEFWSTYTKYLNKARNGTSLPKKDMQRIIKELLDCFDQDELKIGGIFHSTFGFVERLEILKYTTKNGQSIDKQHNDSSIFKVLNKILDKKIQLHGGRKVAAWLKAYSFQMFRARQIVHWDLDDDNQNNCVWPYLYYHLVPTILYNQSQLSALPKKTITLMKRVIENGEDKLGLLSAALALSDEHQNIEKEGKLINILNSAYQRDSVHKLPIVNTALLSFLAKKITLNSYSLKYLQHTLLPIDEKRNTPVILFGKSPNTPFFKSSDEKRYSWYNTTSYSIRILLKAVLNNHDFLTRGELQYLGGKIEAYSHSFDDDIYFYVHPALDALLLSTHKGQQLPLETITVLGKLLDNIDPSLQSKAALILGYVLRNDQNLNRDIIQSLEKYLKPARKNTAKAIKYFVERYGIKDLPKDMLDTLQKASRRDNQDKDLQQVYQEAIEKIIEKEGVDISEENIKQMKGDLKKYELRTTTSAILLKIAMAGKVLPEDVCEALSDILNTKVKSGENKKELIKAQQNASLALSYVAEHKQKLNQESLKNIYKKLQEKKNPDRTTQDNLVQTIGLYASTNVDALVQKDRLKLLVKHMHNQVQDYETTKFLDQVTEKYIQAMRNADPTKGEVLWGGDIELIKIAEEYQCSIHVYTPECQPQKIGKSQDKIIHLWLEGNHYQHYNPEIKKKTNVKADGNCMFYAVLHAFNAMELFYNRWKKNFQIDIQEVEKLRNKVCDQLKKEYDQLANKDQDSIRTRFSMLFEAKNEVQLNVDKQILPQGSLLEDALKLRSLQKNSQENISCTLREILENCKEENHKKKIENNIGKCINILQNKAIYNKETRQNIAQGLAFYAKNKGKIEDQDLTTIFELLSTENEKKVINNLLTSLGYFIDHYEDKRKITGVENIVALLAEKEEKVDQSAYAVLKKIIDHTDNLDSLITSLIEICSQEHVQYYATCLLHIIAQKKIKIFTKNQLAKYSAFLLESQDVEVLEKMAIIFEKYVVEANRVLDTQTVKNLEKALIQSEDAIVTDIIVKILYKSYIDHKHQMNVQMFDSLVDKIEINPQAISSIFVYFSDKKILEKKALKIDKNILAICDYLKEIPEKSVQKNRIKIFNHYLFYNYDENDRANNSFIFNELQLSINSIDTIAPALEGLQWFVQKTDFRLRNDIPEILTNILIKENLDQKIRKLAYGILENLRKKNIAFNLPEHLQSVFAIEKKLNENMNDRKCLKECKKLLAQGQYLSISSLEKIENILKRNSQYQKQIYDILLQFIQNGQQLPYNFMQVIIDHFKNQSIEDITESILFIINQYIQDTDTIPEGFISVLEEKIKEKTPGIINANTLDILSFAAKKFEFFDICILEKFMRRKNSFLKEFNVKKQLPQIFQTIAYAIPLQEKIPDEFIKRLKKYSIYRYKKEIVPCTKKEIFWLYRALEHLQKRVEFEKTEEKLKEEIIDLYKSLQKETSNIDLANILQNEKEEKGFETLMLEIEKENQSKNLSTDKETLFNFITKTTQAKSVGSILVLQKVLEELEKVKEWIEKRKEKLEEQLEKKNPKKIQEEIGNLDIFLKQLARILKYRSRLYTISNKRKEKIIRKIKDFLLLEEKIDNYLLFFDDNFEKIKILQKLALIKNLYPLLQPIKEWQTDDIKNWSNFYKENKLKQTGWERLKDNYLFFLKSNKHQEKYPIQNQEIPEILAIIQNAIWHHTKNTSSRPYYPRTIQSLTTLYMWKAKDQGLLSQVSTGEGKSLIISMFTILKALEGYRVDVITSSPLLAQRDAEEYSSLYNYFGLKTKDNSDAGYNFDGPKACYKPDTDIVYGDVSNFQFDVLRHDYSGLNTRGDCKFENTYTIVDEVDSMLIDDSSRIAMLAETMPGMDELKLLLIAIWQELEAIETRFVKTDEGILYYKDLQEKYHLVNKTKYLEYIQEKLKNYAENLIQNIFEEKTEFRLPKHLKKYAQKQIPKWVAHAIEAKFVYKNGHQYLITKNSLGIDCITPIDYTNTGIVQTNTTWGDGLHQFLQIKEGLKVTSETLITNFLSNKAYFEKYNNKVVGLTGTLGSEPAKKLLGEVYQMNHMTIPKYKPSQFIEEPALLLSQEKYEAELLQIIKEKSLKRTILIICETKKYADNLLEKLQKENIGRLIPYTRDDNNEKQAISNTYGAGDIIVATNLAGRGTDFHITKSVEQAGGLYVCLTFLPKNLRVEKQAFGRAGRKGQQGSAQLILNKDQLPSIYAKANDIKTIRKIREQEEKKRLENFTKNELPIIDLKDGLFIKFCEILKKFREEEKGDFIEKTFHQYQRKAAEERWGLFLKHADYKNTSKTKEELKKLLTTFEDEYENFEVKEEKDIHFIKKSKPIIQNPLYYIQYGNTLFERASRWFNYFSSSKKPLYKKAKEAYEQAIKLDPNYAYAAYFQKGYATIELQSDNKNYKQEAKKYFKKANELIQNHFITQLLSLQANARKGKMSNLNSAFTQQLGNKINILKAVADTGNNAIQTITRSQKLIDVIPSTGEAFEALQKEEALKKINSSEAIKTFYQAKDSTSDISYEEDSLIDIKDSKTLTLQLHNLKAHSDIMTSYQTKNTVEKALKKHPKVAGNIAITFDHLSKAQLLEALPACMDEEKRKKTLEEKQAKEKAKEAAAKEKMSKEEYEHQFWYQKTGKKIKNAGIGLGNMAKGIGNGIKYVFQGTKNVTYHLIPIWKNEVNKAKEIPATIKMNQISLEDVQTIFDTLQEIEINLAWSNPNKNEANQQIEHQGITIKQAKEKIEDLKKQIKKNVAQDVGIDYEEQSMIEEVDSYLEDSEVENQSLKSKHNASFSSESYKSSDSEEENTPTSQGLEIMITTEKNITSDDAKILQKFTERQWRGVRINITLLNISQYQAKEIIEKISEEIRFDLSFEKLHKDNARRIVYINEDFIGDSVLKFENLAQDQAAYIVENADRKEQEVKLQEVKKLDRLFLKSDFPSLAIAEAKASGIIGLPMFYEQQPIKWTSVGTVTALGAVQIGAGMFLIVCPNYGTALIGEGVGDLITAFRGAYCRDFSWQDYTTQKAISMSISLASAGISRLKNMGKAGQVAQVEGQLAQNAEKQGVGQIIQNVEKQGLQQAEQKILEESVKKGTQEGTKQSTKTVWMTGFRKDCLKTGGKYALANLGESIAVEGIGNLVDGGIHQLMETYVRPEILAYTEDKLRMTYTSPKVNKALGIDDYLDTKNYYTQIEGFPAKVLFQEKSRMENALYRIGVGVMNKSTKYSLVQNAIKGKEMLQAIHKAKTITDTLNASLQKQIEKMELLEKPMLLTHGIEDPKAKDEIKKALEKYDVIKKDVVDIEKLKNKLGDPVKKDIERLEKNVEKIENTLKINYESERNMLCAKASNQLADNIMQTIEGGIIKPMTSYAINKGVIASSNWLQKKLNGGKTIQKEIETLQHTAQMLGKYRGMMDKLDKNSETYKKCEELLDETIKDAKTGKGNLLHLLILAETANINGKKVKFIIHRKGEPYTTIGDGDHTIVLNHDGNDHWETLDKNGNPQSGNNNCLFDAIAAEFNVGKKDIKSGDPAQKLRNMVVEGLEKNREHYINDMPGYAHLCEEENQEFGGMWRGGIKEGKVYIFYLNHARRKKYGKSVENRQKDKNNNEVYHFECNEHGLPDQKELEKVRESLLSKDKEPIKIILWGHGDGKGNIYLHNKNDENIIDKNGKKIKYSGTEYAKSICNNIFSKVSEIDKNKKVVVSIYSCQAAQDKDSSLSSLLIKDEIKKNNSFLGQFYRECNKSGFCPKIVGPSSNQISRKKNNEFSRLYKTKSGRTSPTKSKNSKRRHVLNSNKKFIKVNNIQKNSINF